MPWIPIYADEVDMDTIIESLNSDNEIAFIIYDGQGKIKNRWKVVNKITDNNQKRICIWHISSGPLFNDYENSNHADEITDPWIGWEEKSPSEVKGVPFFKNDAGIFWLNNWSRFDKNIICLSSFEWIGNYFSEIGQKESKETEKYWKKLRRIIEKQSIKIGRTDEMKPEIYCMKNAFDKIKQGYKRDINPRKF